jgi:hypothetical protein
LLKKKVAVDGVVVAVRVVVAAWQWDHWIGHTLAVILNGDILQIGAILTEFGLYLYFYKKSGSGLGGSSAISDFFYFFFWLRSF